MQFYLFLSSELLLSNNAKFSFSPGFPNSRKDYDADIVTLLQGDDVIGPSAIPSRPFGLVQKSSTFCSRRPCCQKVTFPLFTA